MATIGEVDLSLGSPFLFTRSAPLQDSKHNNGPFRATQIWNEVIQHLKSNVEIKRRRQKMRLHKNCFTGADAVDVVLHYLLKDPDMLCADPSRDKAMRLCQTLMDKKVFESVIAKVGDGKKVFDDSHSKLYRFIQTQQDNSENVSPKTSDEENDTSGGSEEISEDDELQVKNLEEVEVTKQGIEEMRIDPSVEPDLIGEGIICNPVATRKSSFLQEITQLQKSVKRKNSNISERNFSSKRQKLSDSWQEGNKDLSFEEIEDIWREVALRQLLTIVDLPFLDSILNEDKQKRHSRQFSSNFISNEVAKHCSLPCIGAKDISDPYMRTAVDCMQNFSRSSGLQDEVQDFSRYSDSKSKLEAYSVICEYYSQQSEPLLQERYLDLMIAILNLVIQEKNEAAVKALQLSVVLLSHNTKVELHCLLKYMATAAEDNELQLDTEEDNETVLLLTFTDKILKHKLIAHSLATVLIAFLMHHVDKIFTVPDQLREAVNTTIQQDKEGDISLVQDPTFCNQVSQTEYQRQSQECTQKGLVLMMNYILDATNISLKEKKQKLRHFQKYHPHLYSKHFSGMI
ncbi:hypothetical protein CHS0354_002725 [Potamilus streckersoni]|uniref:DEP domain-containing protein n=1 Tax=Potamilus streckersoni TaxID=2493646 RepID=A0AAE0SKI2_9BIVA|nr:hypothetical protein CHS0354_002725 [Potamilus streckersoni]